MSNAQILPWLVPDAPPAEAPQLVEHLPFVVCAAQTAADLAAAVALRQRAYARHLPQFAARLAVPEAMDTERGSTVLLARSKLDDSVLGSLRVQTNEHRSLDLERSVGLPAALARARLAEAVRLSVAAVEPGRLVKAALFKAFYLLCLQRAVDHMVITARSPIDRQYQRLLFSDIHAPGECYPMAHVGGLPHRVMALHVPSARPLWTAAGHPLLGFMCATRHPDIHLPPPAGPLLH